jgi:hypothetical protein
VFRSRVRAAIQANPSGALTLRVTPQGSLMQTTAGLRLDEADGVNSDRPITIDFNGMTISGGEPGWDKSYDRLPIFGTLIFTPGQAVQFKIKDAHVHGRYPSSSPPSSLEVSIRLSWVQVRTVLVDPKRTAADEITWSFQKSISDRLLKISDLGYLYRNEIGTTNENYLSMTALWVIPKEPIGSDIPGLAIHGAKNLTIRRLTVRDRTLASKQYFLTQTNDDFDRLTITTPTRFLPTTGLRITKSDGVSVEDSVFFNLDGQALTTDTTTRNYRIVGNIFQEVGGNCLAHGIDHPGDTFFSDLYGFNGLFERNGFYRCALSQFGGSPIVATGSVDLTIRKNIIKEAPYSGITTGYAIFDRGTNASPQYYQNQLSGTVIDGNLVDGVMLRSVDGGGIYSLGPRVRGKIINNTIRNVGAERTPINAQESYGYFVSVGQNNLYPAPVAHLYYDNGSFGWVASNNMYGTQKYSYQTLIFRQTNSGTTEGNADPDSPQGAGTPDIRYADIPLAVKPPMIGGIVDRTAWFLSYGVNP